MQPLNVKRIAYHGDITNGKEPLCDRGYTHIGSTFQLPTGRHPETRRTLAFGTFISLHGSKPLFNCISAEFLKFVAQKQCNAVDKESNAKTCEKPPALQVL
jgi:hypothetical protein